MNIGLGRDIGGRRKRKRTMTKKRTMKGTWIDEEEGLGEEEEEEEE